MSFWQKMSGITCSRPVAQGLKKPKRPFEKTATNQKEKITVKTYNYGKNYWNRLRNN